MQDYYHAYLLNMKLTSGIKGFCEEKECFWFLDVICSYQPYLKSEDFQVWKLTVNKDSTAEVVCTDGNDNILKQQHIPYTDFKGRTAIFWVEGEVVLLPSEH